MLKVLRDEIVWKGERVSIVKRHFVDRYGQSQVYEVVCSNKGKYAVVVLALTPENEIVLVCQQRISLSNDNDTNLALKHDIMTMELPGGVVGTPTQDIYVQAMSTADQELLEETGYKRVGAFTMLAEHVPEDVGRYEMESIIFFTRVEKFGKPRPESTENIQVITVPLPIFSGFIHGRKYLDARIWMAYGIAKFRGLI